MSNWDNFLDTADQFFISYSIHYYGIPLAPVKFFEIGHTVELYLKAAYTKKTGNIDDAVNFGHKLKKIWDACKTLDPSFMPQYVINDSIYYSDFISDNGASLSSVNCVQYLENQELYVILKHLPDIKYLGAPLRTVKEGQSAWVILSQNPYWISFLKELRHYLGYPLPNHHDWIKTCITQKSIPPSAIEYLTNLY